MTLAFSPVNERSYADMLWEHVRDLPTGHILAYGDASLPFDLGAHRSALDPVAKKMEREQSRTLMAVRGVGYKIVRGVEHTGLARRDLKSAQRKARRANLRASTVDKREMSATEQIEIHQLQTRATIFAQWADGTSRRIDPLKD